MTFGRAMAWVFPRAVARGLAALVLAATIGCARAAERPNILVILADDMRYSDLSPYGSEVFTPNVARLANQGMMLSNFHVAAYCAPTRSMLLTGVDNHLIGLGNMIELAADNQRGKPGYEGFSTVAAPLSPRFCVARDIIRSCPGNGTWARRRSPFRPRRGSMSP